MSRTNQVTKGSQMRAIGLWLLGIPIWIIIILAIFTSWV